MYEEHFRLREKPFSLLPNPEYLYLTEKHAAALALLEYSLMSQAGFTVIVGEIGCGKTTLLRHLLNRGDSDVAMGFISNTHPLFGELLQWVLMAFGLDYSSERKIDRYRTFVDFVTDRYAKRQRTLLAIDEAQNLAPETLEELRMLSNINTEKGQALQLILLGQPELLDTLRRPYLHQFAQRIAVDFFIEPLDFDETRSYIRHRVAVAGGKPSIFRKSSFPLIYHHSRGIPRLINLLCDTALVYGFATRRKTITAEIVEEVVRDKTSGRRLWDATVGGASGARRGCTRQEPR